MGKETNIQWCDHTWSPWLGCRKVSKECDNCYITETPPFRVRHIEHGSRREELSEAYWKQPVQWNRQEQWVCDSCGKAWLIGNHPGCRSTPTPKRIFPSLCDWLDKEVPIRLLARFLKLIHDTPNLDWLLLTKRIQNFDGRMDEAMRQMVRDVVDSRVVDWLINSKNGVQAPNNVWLGVSAGTQKAADERIPQLLKTPAKVRFLSVEPMLERIDLRSAAFNGADAIGSLEGIHWVIVGGESGAKARPCNVEWIRNIVVQCQAASVPCFVKQLGSNPCGLESDALLTDKKGGAPAEWPEDLRVRQFPETSL